MTKSTRLLFVCSSNLDRSPAAASLFNGNSKYEAKSCGILPHAETVISTEAIKWADIIFCMEEAHKVYILENFPEVLEKGKEIIVLDVSNEFMREDPGLIKELKEKIYSYLK